MPKEPKPNFASFTKAELVKTVKKLDARQTKLLNEIAQLKATHPDYINEASLERAMVEFKTQPGPYDVVHVTQGPDTVSELVPDRGEWEREMPKPFPWEKK